MHPGTYAASFLLAPINIFVGPRAFVYDLHSLRNSSTWAIKNPRLAGFSAVFFTPFAFFAGLILGLFVLPSRFSKVLEANKYDFFGSFDQFYRKGKNVYEPFPETDTNPAYYKAQFYAWLGMMGVLALTTLAFGFGFSPVQTLFGLNALWSATLLTVAATIVSGWAVGSANMLSYWKQEKTVVPRSRSSSMSTDSNPNSPVKEETEDSSLSLYEKLINRLNLDGEDKPDTLHLWVSKTNNNDRFSIEYYYGEHDDNLTNVGSGFLDGDNKLKAWISKDKPNSLPVISLGMIPTEINLQEDFIVIVDEHNHVNCSQKDTHVTDTVRRNRMHSQHASVYPQNVFSLIKNQFGVSAHYMHGIQLALTATGQQFQNEQKTYTEVRAECYAGVRMLLKDSDNKIYTKPNITSEAPYLLGQAYPEGMRAGSETFCFAVDQFGCVYNPREQRLQPGVPIYTPKYKTPVDAHYRLCLDLNLNRVIVQEMQLQVLQENITTGKLVSATYGEGDEAKKLNLQIDESLRVYYIPDDKDADPVFLCQFKAGQEPELKNGFTITINKSLEIETQVSEPAPGPSRSLFKTPTKTPQKWSPSTPSVSVLSSTGKNLDLANTSLVCPPTPFTPANLKKRPNSSLHG